MKYILFVVALMFSTEAISQGMCALRADVLRELEQKYNEVPLFSGVTSTHAQIVEVYVSSSGSFTIIATTPNCQTAPQCTCMIQNGASSILNEKIEHALFNKDT